ncbi:MAG: DinB family protein [Acidobacteriota bacterium]
MRIGNPSELALQYQANQTTASRLLSIPHAQLKLRKNNQWNAVDCIQHLILTNTMLSRAMHEAVEARAAGNRASAPFFSFSLPAWMESWMLKQIEPPVRFKFKAPAVISPDSGIAEQSPKEILDAYVASHAPLLALLQKPIEQLERVRFIHPARSMNLSVIAGLSTIAAHDRRHLWQAERSVGMGREL